MQEHLLRRVHRLDLSIPPELPISVCRDELIERLGSHRVIVVCGDTGSGKTTQLPKICMAAGLGERALIGHTQPRRIAARAVAARLAAELGTQVGGAVGLKVRFTDRTAASSVVKVMTDGILLNEIREDRWLRAYDALIIDEAHERSVNIDFLLGYLKRISRRRPELKVIVTSATLDPQRLAAHFDGAPVLRVEGRSYPVEVRYRPPAERTDLPRVVVDAVQELARIDVRSLGGPSHRDMLVFLPGERWIRDTQQALTRAGPKDYEVLPLYARLTSSRQDRIFSPGGTPRIVLATNVAETSLTVPRIRYVIDSGLARVSRYSAGQRIQGLAVEPVAQANAVQRAGRCGRLAPGICVRLYTEEDFVSRPVFGDPEILRTDLAGVILRLEALGLGHIDDFPFIDAPPERAVSDAYRLLHLLGALDNRGRLSRRGRTMARLPLDPRLARMLVAAREHDAVADMLVISAAMSVVDPRERPPDAADAARREQDKLADRRSDFVTWLNLWQVWQRERRKGAKAARTFCDAHFLSLARMREWGDVRAQLADLVRSLGWKARKAAAADYRTIHRCVLAAFVDHVAELDRNREYRGVQGTRATLFPGTPVARKPPRWIVAGERIATERRYLRTVARINPGWAIDVAPHLIRREWRDPVWDERRGRVTAVEVVSLSGLVLSADRRIDFAAVDVNGAREMFIRDALVTDRLGAPARFLEHNRNMRQRLLDWEARLRSRNLYAGERAAIAFYQSRLPASVVDRRSLNKWLQENTDASLRMTVDDIATRDAATLDAARYPSTMLLAGHELPLRYRYEPPSETDGITVSVPLALLDAIEEQRLEWLVPGWLPEKVTAMLRTLPKIRRRELVPLPDTAAEVLTRFDESSRNVGLTEALSEALGELGGGEIAPTAFDIAALPAHLTMRIEVSDDRGRVIGSGRDLAVLRRAHGCGRTRPEVPAPGEVARRWQRRALNQWDFPDLPDRVEVPQHRQRLGLYPSLMDRDGQVDLVLLPPGPAAIAAHRDGVRRLHLKSLPQQCALVRQRVLADQTLLLSYLGIGTADVLVDDLLCAAADESFVPDGLIRDRGHFVRVRDAGRGEFVAASERLVTLFSNVLGLHREIRRRIRDAGRSLPDDVRADIGAQLDALVYPYCLSKTPLEWRQHLPRYLKAVAVRLDRIGQRHPKDAEFQACVGAAAGRLAAWRERQPPGRPWPADVMRYRWLLEEFRVSLFAQSLGTVAPVSERRLADAWDCVKSVA